MVLATGMSEKLLQNYVNNKYAQVLRSIKCTKKKPVNSPFNVMKCGHLQAIKIINNGCGQRLIQKLKKLWVFTQGREEKKGQHRLWNSLPGVLRPCAVCYTDFWSAYELVFPDSRHKSVGKETGLTAYIERLNNTLRQRISRLVRKTLSFSKKLENHLGAIWYFINHYNEAIASL